MLTNKIYILTIVPGEGGVFFKFHLIPLIQRLVINNFLEQTKHQPLHHKEDTYPGNAGYCSSYCKCFSTEVYFAGNNIFNF